MLFCFCSCCSSCLAATITTSSVGIPQLVPIGSRRVANCPIRPYPFIVVRARCGGAGHLHFVGSGFCIEGVGGVVRVRLCRRSSSSGSSRSIRRRWCSSSSSSSNRSSSVFCRCRKTPSTTSSSVTHICQCCLMIPTRLHVTRIFLTLEGTTIAQSMLYLRRDRG